MDPETNKPMFGFVIKSKFIEEGGLPSAPEDEAWNILEPQYVAMASQIIQPPRHFIRTIDDIRVRSLFNDKDIVFLLEWDDRTESHRDANGEATYDFKRLSSLAFPAINTTQYTHENNREKGPLKGVNPEPEGVYNDGIGLQFPFPQVWETLPAPLKPYFIHGDEKNGVDLWKWQSDGTLEEIAGHGIDALEVREDQNLKIVYSKWADGRWQLILKRALLTEDKEKSVQLVTGKNIPMTFFAWDGDAGETGGRMALSTFYYLMMEPPIPQTVYIVPPIVFFVFVGLLCWARAAAIQYKKDHEGEEG
ncbi:MAG: hypothetical protein GXO96_03825 [Nitrospirae bacterium]|nr:hypothetical protein [Candidatus Manganitrophaceae bacterium]